MICTIAVLALLAVPGITRSAPIRVVATEDSHTVQYADHGTRFQDASDALAPGRFEAVPVSFTGLDSPEYAGLLPNRYGDTIDYTAAPLAQNPDIAIWMLGTIDAHHDALGRNYFNNNYRQLAAGFLQRFLYGGRRVHCWQSASSAAHQ